MRVGSFFLINDSIYQRYSNLCIDPGQITAYRVKTVWYKNKRSVGLFGTLKKCQVPNKNTHCGFFFEKMAVQNAY